MHTFTARQVVETRAAALRSRALRESRIITESFGLAWVNTGDDIRWNENTQQGEARIAGLWYALSALCIETWAVEEGLALSEPLSPGQHTALAAGIEQGRAIRARLAEDIAAVQRDLNAAQARLDELTGRLDDLSDYDDALSSILDDLCEPLIDSAQAEELLDALNETVDELDDERREMGL